MQNGCLNSPVPCWGCSLFDDHKIREYKRLVNSSDRRIVHSSYAASVLFYLCNVYVVTGVPERARVSLRRSLRVAILDFWPCFCFSYLCNLENFQKHMSFYSPPIKDNEIMIPFEPTNISLLRLSLLRRFSSARALWSRPQPFLFSCSNRFLPYWQIMLCMTYIIWFVVILIVYVIIWYSLVGRC